MNSNQDTVGTAPLSARGAIADLNVCRDTDLGYEEICRRFVLDIPKHYNMAVDTVGRRASGAHRRHAALEWADETGRILRWSYSELDDLSDRFAAFLRGRGIGRADVVLCCAPQGLISAVAPLAVYKLGAIHAPLSLLYGPGTLEQVIADSGARAMTTQGPVLTRLRAEGVRLDGIDLLVCENPGDSGAEDFARALTTPKDGFVPVTTAAEDPALLLYTSGSTGMPKGILHAHRFLLGYLASVSMFYELEMNRPGMVLWTPSDWSWIAGIVNVMMTGWHFGHRVVAGQDRFSAEWAFGFLERHAVTHCFLAPTALKRMAQIRNPRRRWPGLVLRAIGTGGEPLPGAVLDWARACLNVPINEFYGLTEVNHLIGNCQRLFPVRAGSMGRVYPGHDVAVIDAAGHPLPDGTTGEIAARGGDPTLFLGYWRQPEKTAAMQIGPWVRTGDFARRDAQGYFWYEGRDDDLIKSSGYRIGPAEVEETLLRHTAVAEAGVIGKPDPDRGQIVMAFVRLNEGVDATSELAAELQDFVRRTLAAHKYPREIRFVTEYPLTTTGKISRKELRRMVGREAAGQPAALRHGEEP